LQNDAGGAVARVQAPAAGAPVIIKQVGFSVSTDRPYLAEVEMRAELSDDVSKRIYWDIKQDVSPWRTEAGQTVSVTNQWKKFVMTVQPTFPMDGIGRFGLSVENVGATLYLRNWRFYQAP